MHVELIQIHSPLLKESCLVSYPPLTYMLKLSGVANLISCLNLLLQQVRDSKTHNVVKTASSKQPEHYKADKHKKAFR